MQTILAAGLTAGAVVMLAATPFLAWWGGVWFRARGAGSGTFTYGFPGSTLDRLICAALLTAPWLLVALAADMPGVVTALLPVDPLAFDAGAIAAIFLANLGVVSLAHGNYFSLGERPAGVKPEPPMSWFLDAEPVGADEDARTRHQTKGAAIRIALLGLPSVLAAILLVSLALAPLAALLVLALVVAKMAANARRNPEYARRLKRRLRVDRWGDDAGMKPGWELLEFMAGAFGCAVSGLSAGIALGLLAVRAWGA